MQSNRIRTKSKVLYILLLFYANNYFFKNFRNTILSKNFPEIDL